MPENPKLDFIVRYLRDHVAAGFFEVKAAYEATGGPGYISRADFQHGWYVRFAPAEQPAAGQGGVN